MHKGIFNKHAQNITEYDINRGLSTGVANNLGETVGSTVGSTSNLNGKTGNSVLDQVQQQHRTSLEPINMEIEGEAQAMATMFDSESMVSNMVEDEELMEEETAKRVEIEEAELEDLLTLNGLRRSRNQRGCRVTLGARKGRIILIGSFYC